MEHRFLTVIICFGFLVLSFFYSTKEVNALSLRTNISEKYTDVEAGERLYFEVDVIYPENPRRKDLILNYEVEKDGEIVTQSKVLKAIETQAQFLDFIVIPEFSDSGIYTLKVKVGDYEQLATEVSTTFRVRNGEYQQIQVYFFILLGVVALVAILTMVNIVLVRRKNK